MFIVILDSGGLKNTSNMRLLSGFLLPLSVICAQY